MILVLRVVSVLSLLLLGGVQAEPRALESPAGPGSLAPGLVALDEGRAVLSWLEAHDDGHAFRFSVFDGEQFGPAKTIAAGKDWFVNWADTPAIFVLPGGDWIAHWLVKSGPATFAYDVIFARSTDQGRSWTQAQVVHDDGTQTQHGFVSYFAWDADTAGMVWLDGRYTADGDNGGNEPHNHHGQHGDMTLRTARIGPGGAVSERLELVGRVCDCCPTAAAMTDDGPVVIYRGRSEDEIRDILVVRHADGSWHKPAIVHADNWQIGGCPVNGPDLVARGNELLVAWFTMPEGVPVVRVARSVDAGRSFELTAELGQGSALGRVALTSSDEAYALLWLDQPATRTRLMLTELDGAGQVRASRELIELDGGRASGFPQVVGLDRRGGLLLAWTESGPARQSQVRTALLLSH